MLDLVDGESWQAGERKALKNAGLGPRPTKQRVVLVSSKVVERTCPIKWVLSSTDLQGSGDLRVRPIKNS